MSTLNRELYILFGLALLLLAWSVLLTVYSGVSPFVAVVWNVLSSLDISYSILPLQFASSQLVFASDIIDAFVFALLAFTLATWFFGFVREIDVENRITTIRVKRLKDHIIVAPFNSFANSLVKELKEAEQKYVVLGKGKESRSYMHRNDIFFISGAADSIETFKDAGVERARYVIACSDDDTENALITLTAKSSNRGVAVFSRVSYLENIPKLNKAGVNKMLLPEVSAGKSIADVMSGHFE
ncbi:MAG: NAD-binding protein [Candidatus Marsarchaeota archaeon]|jgi:voltage-gated potassium channel|nr:NAD-binding protein [Candidatus Marsarchaeota archaeon]